MMRAAKERRIGVEGLRSTSHAMAHTCCLLSQRQATTATTSLLPERVATGRRERDRDP